MALLEDNQNTEAPKPYFTNTDTIKAFVLGCDPTAKDKQGNPLFFEYVFDIKGDKRYFAGIKGNLRDIGLSIDDIYVQNLITNYLDAETSENKGWMKEAVKHIESRKQEFDAIDPSRKFPVFLTSEVLHRVLVLDGQKSSTAADLYANPQFIPLKPDSNKLGRALIPLYRHSRYQLKKQKEYTARLIQIVKEI